MTTKDRVYKKTEGFTLIELLVVISIIALLLSILMPALSKVKKLAQRLQCTNAIHQWALASYAYSIDNNDYFLPTHITNREHPSYDMDSWGQYDTLFQMNYKMWKIMHQQYGVPLEQMAGCTYTRKHFQKREVVFPGNSLMLYEELIQLGWVIWANRDDFTDGDTGEKFKMPRKTSDNRSDTKTFMTCYCWNSYVLNPGGGGYWNATHVPTSNTLLYSNTEPMDPKPEGLGTGLLDGSAGFVKWDKLEAVNHGAYYRVWHVPK